MSSRVYVGRLGYGCRESDLERFFKGYGRIRGIILKNGFGFVEFEDSRDADDAVYELNGKDLLGERVILEIARGPSRRNRFPPRRRGWVDKYGYGPATRTEYRVVVENLSSRVSWQELKDFMRQAGEVTYADAHKRKRNEGMVEFSSYSDMKNAIKKYDGYEMNGRKIKMTEERPHKSRRSRSKSSSRSRSRSRTRTRRSRSRSRSKSRAKSGSRSPSRGERSGRKSPSNDDELPTRSPEEDEKSSPRDEGTSKSKDGEPHVEEEESGDQSPSNDEASPNRDEASPNRDEESPNRDEGSPPNRDEDDD